MTKDTICVIAPDGSTDRKSEIPAPAVPARPPALPKEIGGPAGPEPTRYGDWERNGRCTDF
jgi:hypothetical protein